MAYFKSDNRKMLIMVFGLLIEAKFLSPLDYVAKVKGMRTVNQRV